MQWMIPESLERQLKHDPTVADAFGRCSSLRCYDHDPKAEEDEQPIVATSVLYFYNYEEYPDGCRVWEKLRKLTWLEALTVAVYTAHMLHEDIDRDYNATRLGKDILRAVREAR